PFVGEGWGERSAGATATLITLPPERASWTLEYLLQATDDPSLLVPAGEVWRQRGSTLNFLNRKFDAPQERLLAGLGRAARLFPALEPSLRTARPETATLTTSQAYSFVREAALLLQGSGFGVLVPGMDTAIGVRAKLSSPTTKKQAQGGAAVLTWATLVNYDWQIALGDQTLSRAEFEALAAFKQPLVQVRGRWVELRPELVEQALILFKTQASGPIGMATALRMALAPATVPGLPLVEVETEGGFHDLLTALRDGGGRAEIAEPPGFQGQLRPYQRVGVGWLAAMRRFGLGAVLADDMGLGKTIQLIALLLHERQVAPGATGPTLLICPTSVVGNWRRELTRFGPDLRVLVHHGAERSREERAFAAEAGGYDVVISTYALLHRDEAALTAVQWANVVLDEAQNIKNPATKWAQAARRLSADWRAALTGTPVENRLAELWSLFQFLNPGYLGSQEAFRRQFALPIERARDETAVEGLKALVSPFILRRLKTDRSIIADLPDKNEMKLYATLTREQATLYEAALQDGLGQMAEAEGIARRGIILGMLTKLKQICDHPALFLHDGSPLLGRSGKLARLTEMLEELLALDDRALIFTQYAEMGKLLQPHLSAALGREVIFLYGGTTAPERDRLVSRFQNDTHGPPIFILSVKAGGVGLNLTRANHVFHFDRWWNPAVENQATDRAFRIGQQKNVQVHKFISAGTFEEALDEIIERKKDLAETIVGAGESWITEMSTEQLRDLFTLRRDAIGEE
ncbi:MAG: DEAD/DEAH box helicase, partial [Chloroflexota bacterium]|nr:DEAD/DEAH box helicase [Chloroflexota bacterium]